MRRLLVLLLVAVLSGCYFLPGSFDAQLDLHRDGTFTYRYKGELVFLVNENLGGSPPSGEWSDADARCVDDKTGDLRPCAATEIAAQKADHVARMENERRERQQMAAMIGYAPFDDAANHRLAREMMQYEGWNKVEFKGNGVFEVDYETSGRLDREFVFPVLPQAQLMVPLVHVRRTRSGLVEVDAPGMVGGTARKLLASNGRPDSAATTALFDRINGRFVVTTDAIIAASNGRSKRGDDGVSNVQWTIARGEADSAGTNPPRLQIEMAP